MKVLHAALALMVAAVLLGGCGGGDEATADKRLECPRKTAAETPGKQSQPPRKAWLSLHRNTGPEVVGILMAEKHGYFDDAGIELTATVGYRPAAALQYVQDESIEFGLAQQPQVVMARDKGAPIIAVGALISRPTATMIWLKKSKIEEIADLEGKTIALPGLSSQEAFLENILGEAGLTLEDVELRRVDYDLVSALASGRADAIFGGSWNVDGAALEARGLEPVITRVESLGIPAYEELVVVARGDRVARDPRLIRDFMSAVARGTAAAIENPEEAARVAGEGGEVDPALGPRATRAGVQATLPLLAEAGCMDPDQATELIDWMREEGQIKRELPASAVLTNRYVTP
jgi:ABC-type nitrate/sulfonate/bicarbonate transport system substrate-binding protein